MMFQTEPCRCPACGKKTYYDVILSCNSFMMNMLPSNLCNCGNQLYESDIILNECSPEYRNIYRTQQIFRRMEEMNVGEEDQNCCEQCGNKQLSRSFSVGIKIPEKYKSDTKISVHNSQLTCSNCGYVKFDIYDEISDLYDFVEQGENEGDIVVRKKDDYEETLKKYNEKQAEEFQKVEDILIAEGVINSSEEEQKYKNTYYENIKCLLESS